MARLTAGEIYSDLTAAGYSPAAAVVQTAIALATSGGDLAYTAPSTPGPAYGLYGIRVDPAATGSGSPRDVTYLAQGRTAQAQAAYRLTNSGADFTAFDAFRTGRHTQYLGQVRAAAGPDPRGPISPGDGSAVTLPGGVPPAQPASNPLLPDGDQLAGKLRQILIVGAALSLGTTLLVLGAVRAVGPTLARRAGEAVKTATTVVKAVK